MTGYKRKKVVKDDFTNFVLCNLKDGDEHLVKIGEEYRRISEKIRSSPWEMLNLICLLQVEILSRLFSGSLGEQSKLVYNFGT